LISAASDLAVDALPIAARRSGVFTGTEAFNPPNRVMVSRIGAPGTRSGRIGVAWARAAVGATYTAADTLANAATANTLASLKTDRPKSFISQ
jgi:hypothetical protein